jgi:Ser/Thr protein kinase RdoA (MazF antagonist)
MSADTVDRQRLAGLHRLLAHVHNLGVTQVAVPLAGLDGATFFEAQGQIWQLEPWMPGSADFVANPSEPRLHAALLCLAHWHRAAARFVARDADANWFFSTASAHSPGLAERCRQIARWTAPECAALRRRLADLKWKEFEELAREILDAFVSVAPRVAVSLKIGIDVPVPLQPCLRDVWHDHVLFTGDIVTGLIDAHAARSDSVATDLARLLGTLVGDERWRWDGGLAAYQEVRPLLAVELAMIELFDQSGVLLSGMTWLDWLLLQVRVFKDREPVLARLRSITGRLRNLVSRYSAGA